MNQMPKSHKQMQLTYTYTVHARLCLGQFLFILEYLSVYINTCPSQAVTGSIIHHLSLYRTSPRKAWRQAEEAGRDQGCL